MPRKSPLERFMEKIEKDAATGCWVWKAALHNAGYGCFYFAGRQVRAHRWAYEHFKGPIAPGREIDHLCRRVGCVNPDHLEAVTPRENQMRSTSVSARAARATECPQGHPYDDENTLMNADGSRRCRLCNRAHALAGERRMRERRKALAQGRPIPPWAQLRN